MQNPTKIVYVLRSKSGAYLGKAGWIWTISFARRFATFDSACAARAVCEHHDSALLLSVVPHTVRSTVSAE